MQKNFMVKGKREEVFKALQMFHNRLLTGHLRILRFHHVLFLHRDSGTHTNVNPINQNMENKTF